MLGLLLWWEGASLHPMQGRRKQLLLIFRAAAVVLGLLALAGPARELRTDKQALVLILDHSQSLGEEGLSEVFRKAEALRQGLPTGTSVSAVALGDEPALIQQDGGLMANATQLAWQAAHGAQSHYAKAISFGRSLFPAGSSRQMVVIGDGEETVGAMQQAAQQAAVDGVILHALPVTGQRKPDARVRELLPNRSRLHEGATLGLTAYIDSTLDGTGLVKLYENGVQVEQRPVTLKAGESLQLSFSRSPAVRDIYKYRAVIEGFSADTLPSNNDALAIVDVRGRLRVLLCEGEPTEAAALVSAMEKEGVALDLRQPGSIPQGLSELAGYDGVVLSDISARLLGEGAMRSLRDYVDKLGGGLLMLGGPNSFGVGGYQKTPIEDLLPVRLRATDEEEKQSSALALVLDRSGSMNGEKLEVAKSAAIAAADVLTRNDFIGVYAFDSEAHAVLPLTRVTAAAAIAAPISTLASGGGTNLEPALQMARQALLKAKAKIKHMIVLTDGQSTGGGYEVTAGQCLAEGISLSTVAIGEGSHVALLQAMAAAGGGQAYSTQEVNSITRIFTQDTLRHTGQMLREEPFYPQVNERHALLAGMAEPWASPSLAGYVKTTRRPSAQLPLITEAGDPLLAHWRFGLGKVTAFTSDAKSRWAGLWIASWQGYARFWSQMLRETCRAPQGQRMDLRLQRDGDRAHIQVDLLADAATRANAAQVKAEVFLVPAGALGSTLRPVQAESLPQTGPGLYESQFTPAEAGVYLVRAQSGADTVSAGLVHNVSSEASMGTVREDRLTELAQATGGSVIRDDKLPAVKTEAALEHVELWPLFTLLMLLAFLADMVVRRWENVQGLWALAQQLRAGR
jgi:Ca-activated chloride channel homolog